MKPVPRRSCEEEGCKRNAKFRATRADKVVAKNLCAAHAAEKYGKYEVKLESLS